MVNGFGFMTAEIGFMAAMWTQNIFQILAMFELFEGSICWKRGILMPQPDLFLRNVLNINPEDNL